MLCTDEGDDSPNIVLDPGILSGAREVYELDDPMLGRVHGRIK